MPVDPLLQAALDAPLASRSSSADAEVCYRRRLETDPEHGRSRFAIALGLMVDGWSDRFAQRLERPE